MFKVPLCKLNTHSCFISTIFCYWCVIYVAVLWDQTQSLIRNAQKSLIPKFIPDGEIWLKSQEKQLHMTTRGLTLEQRDQMNQKDQNTIHPNQASQVFRLLITHFTWCRVLWTKNHYCVPWREARRVQRRSVCCMYIIWTDVDRLLPFSEQTVMNAQLHYYIYHSEAFTQGKLLPVKTSIFLVVAYL